MTTLDISRRQVLGYRLAAQRLTDRADTRPAELAVLDLGVQDTPYGSAALALAARTTAALDDDRLELVWSLRGAPHLHRRADLPAVAGAIWPLTDADAARRIAGQIRAGAALGLAAFRATAAAFGEVVDEPMDKGEVSRAVSDRVPAEVTYDCGPCGARHISGALFQQAGLAGGVRLEVSGRAARLAPLPGWAGPPVRAGGTDALVLAYLRLLGPATPTDVAGFVGTGVRELRTVWPADALTEVRLDGRAAWLPTDRLDALRAAGEERTVRLLPPGDPWLQARDRDLLVPDRSRQRSLWRAIGNPGALLVDGEIAGTWRARQARGRTVELTVTPFDPVPDRVRRAVDEEATVVAAVRGADGVQVRLEG